MKLFDLYLDVPDFESTWESGVSWSRPWDWLSEELPEKSADSYRQEMMEIKEAEEQ